MRINGKETILVKSAVCETGFAIYKLCRVGMLNKAGIPNKKAGNPCQLFIFTIHIFIEFINRDKV